jgi:CRP-like cAMP-binding protein
LKHPLVLPSGEVVLMRIRNSCKGPIMISVGAARNLSQFDTKTFLSTIDGGRKIAAFTKKQAIFIQGDSSDAVFYIRRGRVRLTVVAKSGKEATTGILNEGDFFGEGCLTGQLLRLCSSTAMSDCSVMRIEKTSMMESASPGTRVLGYVRGVFAYAEHPI